MEKIFEFRLLADSGFDEFEFFDKPSRIPFIDKFYVKRLHFSNKDEISDDNYDVIGGVFDLYDNALGYFERRTYSVYMIFTFYVARNEHRQDFFEFLSSTMDDLEFAGFHIKGTRSFGDDPINLENDNTPGFPKTETARNKWRRAYAVIQRMMDEEADSADDEYCVNKLRDFRDGIKRYAELDYSEKTISRIIKAGKDNLLD